MTSIGVIRKSSRRSVAAVLLCALALALSGCSSYLLKRTQIAQIPVSPPRKDLSFDFVSAVPEPVPFKTVDEGSLDRDLVEKKALLEGLETGGDELLEALKKDALNLIARVEARKQMSSSLGDQLLQERRRSEEIKKVLKTSQRVIDKYEAKARVDSKLIRDLQKRYNEAAELANSESKDQKRVSIVSLTVSLAIGIVLAVVAAG